MPSAPRLKVVPSEDKVEPEADRVLWLRVGMLRVGKRGKAGQFHPW